MLTSLYFFRTVILRLMLASSALLMAWTLFRHAAP